MFNNTPLPFGQVQGDHNEGSTCDPADDPLIYLASPLTRLDSKEREHTELVLDKIGSTVLDFGRDSCRYRTHVPAIHSSPWNAHEMSAKEVYAMNAELILAETDAMIVFSQDGGSDGTGNEMTLAARRGIPVLRLASDREATSRQIAGNPSIESKGYREVEELAHAVRSFLRNHSVAIEDGPRRRRATTILYLPLQTDLNARWQALTSDTERGTAASLASVTPQFLDLWLERPSLVAAMSHSQLLKVGNALQLDVNGYFGSFDDPLSLAQLETLLVARDEYGWSDNEAAWLRSVAEQQVVAPGTKRLILNSPGDWLRLMQSVTS